MVEVKAPATSANIGPGFDCLGVCLSMNNRIRMKLWDCCEIFSENTGTVSHKEDNLVYQSAKRVFKACGKPLPGLSISMHTYVPPTRGLGSSSSCIAGGLVGANALLGEPFNKEELLDMAALIEGHPDNVTPALMGGFTSSVMEGDHVRYQKMPLSKKAAFAAFIPSFKLETKVARGILPHTIEYEDAVFNLSRVSMLTYCLMKGEFDNLPLALSDRMHQKYRIPHIPGYDEVVRLSGKCRAYGSFLSGAGPTILSIIDAKDKAFSSRARKALEEKGLSYKVRILRCDKQGTTWKAVQPETSCKTDKAKKQETV